MSKNKSSPLVVGLKTQIANSNGNDSTLVHQQKPIQVLSFLYK